MARSLPVTQTVVGFSWRMAAGFMLITEPEGDDAGLNDPHYARIDNRSLRADLFQRLKPRRMRTLVAVDSIGLQRRRRSIASPWFQVSPSRRQLAAAYGRRPR